MSNLQASPTTPELIEQVIGSGLFSFDDESHFSWQGCEHCANGLGAEVYDVRGYRSLDERELYEFQVCGDCISCSYYGGLRGKGQNADCFGDSELWKEGER